MILTATFSLFFRDGGKAAKEMWRENYFNSIFKIYKLITIS